MRRSSLAFILIALALLGRVLAPLALEARGVDPLANAPICTHDGGSPASSDSDDSGAAHAKLCALSCCHVAPAYFAPPAIAISLVRTAVTTSWVAVALAAKATDKPASPRARGPPILS